MGTDLEEFIDLFFPWRFCYTCLPLRQAE